MTDLARVEPADLGALDDEVAALVTLTENADGEPLRVIATLAHRADLVAPFLTWSAALAGPGSLIARAHELVALRAAWRHGSDYEWGHHVEYAVRDGVTAEEIERVARPGLDDWDDGDRSMLALVDAMCAGTVDDAIRAEAARHHDPAALVEMAWTAGQYSSLSMITDALGVEPEPGLDPCPPGGTS